MTDLLPPHRHRFHPQPLDQNARPRPVNGSRGRAVARLRLKFKRREEGEQRQPVEAAVLPAAAIGLALGAEALGTNEAAAATLGEGNDAADPFDAPASASLEPFAPDAALSTGATAPTDTVTVPPEPATPRVAVTVEPATELSAQATALRPNAAPADAASAIAEAPGAPELAAAAPLSLGDVQVSLLTIEEAPLPGLDDVLGDPLAGEEAPALIGGSAGDDQLTGSAGDDAIIGDAGDDVIEGAAGDDELAGGDGDDILAGGDGDDQLSGGAGDDELSGGAGDDLIVGGAGDDVIIGADGHDTLLGSYGDDLYRLGSVNDVVYEDTSAADGIDTVLIEASFADSVAVFTPPVNVTFTFVGNFGASLPGDLGGYTYMIRAGIENVILEGDVAYDIWGDAAANALLGNDGANILVGGAGDDVLSGGLSADRLTGGAGDDTYVIGHEDDAADEIYDDAGLNWLDIDGIVREAVEAHLRDDGDLLFSLDGEDLAVIDRYRDTEDHWAGVRIDGESYAVADFMAPGAAEEVASFGREASTVAEFGREASPAADAAASLAKTAAAVEASGPLIEAGAEPVVGDDTLFPEAEDLLAGHTQLAEARDPGDWLREDGFEPLTAAQTPAKAAVLMPHVAAAGAGTELQLAEALAPFERGPAQDDVETDILAHDDAFWPN